MDKDQFDQATSSGPQAADGQALSARRRLLKGGLGLAPVAMTVTSRPVLATGTCHGPTGFHSANLSRKVGTTPCAWKKPADWCSSSGSDWPTACKSKKDLPFKDVFGAADPTGAIQNTWSVWKVISQTSNTAESCKIGKLIVAAWLNSAASPNAFPMTEAQVKEIWVEHNTVGFRPGGDTQAWDATKIQKYLWYTMGVVF